MEEIKSTHSLDNFPCVFEDHIPSKNSSNLQFLQRFGERRLYTNEEDDLITSLSFDRSGSHLAVGDHAGRLIVFRYSSKRDELNEDLTNDQLSSCLSNSASAKCTTCEKKYSISFDCDNLDISDEFEFEYIHEFQSHQKDVDFLKNQEVSPQINNIKWLTPNGLEMSLITSNSKSIKLWRIKENTKKDSFIFTSMPTFSSKVRQNFYKLHDYAINSLSIAKNDESFLTSDDLKINLWDLNEPNKPYNLIDMTPFDIDDLSEVITSCNFHPFHDHLFTFGSSQGNLRIGDLRKNGVCDRNCLTLKNHHKDLYKDCEEFSALIRSVSNCQFLKQDYKIIARDYLNIFVWDIRNDKAPEQIIPIHEPLKGKLHHLFKNEQIFDQFSLAVQPGETKVLTGNYDDSFHLIDLENQRNMKYKIMEGEDVKCEGFNDESCKNWNFENKILKSEFHPHNNSLAIACQNCLYLFKK